MSSWEGDRLWVFREKRGLQIALRTLWIPLLVRGATDAPAGVETSPFLCFSGCSRLLKVLQHLEELMLLMHAPTLFSHINQLKCNCIFRIIISQVVPPNALWSGS